MFGLGFIKDLLGKSIPQKIIPQTESEEDALERELMEYFQLTPQQFTFNPETKLTLKQIDDGMEELQDFMERSTERAGYPASDVDILMSINHGRIGRLLTGSGIPREMAQQYLLPCIRNLAKVVHLIPASRSYHHRNCGGLFMHSLDVAWRANQKARTKYFRVADTVGDKSTAQDKWMIACMIGALCHDAGKVVTDVLIKPSPHSMKYYGPYSGETLYDWIQRECDRRYFVEWTGKGKEHEKAMQTVFSNIVPNETLAWLGNNVARELIEFCQGELTPEESVLTEVITLSDSESTRYNRLNGEFDYNNPNEADYLLTAIRRLIMIPRIHKATTQRGDTTVVEIRGVKVKGFSINTPHSELLLFSEDKLFLCWEAFREIRKIYQLNSVDSRYLAPGMERELDEDELEVETLPLLDFLEKAGFITLFPDKNDSRTRRYRWWIGRYNSSKPNEAIKPFRAICFNARAISKLFEDEALPTPIRTQVYFFEGPKGPAEITHSINPLQDPSALKPGTKPRLNPENNPTSFGPDPTKTVNNGTDDETEEVVESEEDLQQQLQDELQNEINGTPAAHPADATNNSFSTEEPNAGNSPISATEGSIGANSTATATPLDLGALSPMSRKKRSANSGNSEKKNGNDESTTNTPSLSPATTSTTEEPTPKNSATEESYGANDSTLPTPNTDAVDAADPAAHAEAGEPTSASIHTSTPDLTATSATAPSSFGPDEPKVEGLQPNLLSALSPMTGKKKSEIRKAEKEQEKEVKTQPAEKNEPAANTDSPFSSLFSSRKNKTQRKQSTSATEEPVAENTATTNHSAADAQPNSAAVEPKVLPAKPSAQTSVMDVTESLSPDEPVASDKTEVSATEGASAGEVKASATTNTVPKNTATHGSSGIEQFAQASTEGRDSPSGTPAEEQTAPAYDNDGLDEFLAESPPMEVYMSDVQYATQSEFDFSPLTDEEYALYANEFPEGFEPVIRMENPWVVYLQYPEQEDGTPGISITTRFEGDCSEANWTAIVHVPLGLDYEEPTDKRYSVVRRKPTITGRQVRNAVVKPAVPNTPNQKGTGAGSQVTGEDLGVKASTTVDNAVKLTATKDTGGMKSAQDTLAENVSSSGVQQVSSPTSSSNLSSISSSTSSSSTATEPSVKKVATLTESATHSLSQAPASIPQDTDGEDEWEDEEEIRSFGDGKGNMTFEQFALALQDDLKKEGQYRRVQIVSETDSEIVISHNEISRLCTLYGIELSQFFVQSRNTGLLSFNTTQLNFTYTKQ